MTLREWIDKFKQEIQGSRWSLAISIFTDHIFMNPQYHNRCVPTDEYVELIKENLRVLGQRAMPDEGWTTVSIMILKNEEHNIYSGGGFLGKIPYSVVFLPDMNKGVLALHLGKKTQYARFSYHFLSKEPRSGGNGKNEK